jgi:CHAT domain-containing protein
MKRFAALLFVLSSLSPAGTAAAENPSKVVSEFATALVHGDVRAFEPIIDDIPMSDDLEWWEVRELADRFDCIEVRSWRVLSTEVSAGTATLRVRLDASGTTRGAQHRRLQFEDDWTLILVQRDGGWRLRTATTTAWAVARRLADLETAAWPAAIAAVPDLDRRTLARAMADLGTGATGPRLTRPYEENVLRFREIVDLARTLAEDTGDIGTIAFCRRMHATSHRDVVNHAATAAEMANALDLARQAGYGDEVASSLFSVGFAASLRHDLTTAVETMEEEGAMIDALDDPRRALKALNMLILFRMNSGDYRSALLAARKLEQESKRYHWNEGVADATYYAASIYGELANYELAEGLYRRAAETYHDLRNQAFESETRIEEGACAIAGGRPDRARKLLLAALASAKGQGTSISRSEMLLAKIAANEGKLAEAQSLLERAVTRDSEVEQRYWAMSELSRVQLARHHANEAMTTARAAIPLAAKGGRSPWKAQHALGMALLSLGRRDEAAAAFRDTIDSIDRVRSSKETDGFSSVNFLGDKFAPYVALAGLLVSQHRAHEALAVAERMKARSLLDALRQGRSAAADVLTEEEAKKRAALEEQVVTLNRELLAMTEAARDAKREQLAEARRELDRNTVEMGLLHPELRLQPGVPAAEPALPDSCRDATVIEYVVGERETLAFVVRRKGAATRVEVRRLAVPRSVLTKKIQRLRRQIEGRDLNEMASARALYDLLLRPLAPLIPSGGILGIVPHGEIWNVPFQVLAMPSGKRVIERYAIFYAPSIALLDTVKRREAATQELFAFGNPTLAGSSRERPAAVRGFRFGPLPDAESEVIAIGKMYTTARSQVLTRTLARETVFKQEAGRYRVLHLATHGLFDDRAPMYSALALAAADTDADDGLLESREILGMHLNADVAVLSACDTARGRISDGEGMVGMSWAFMAAGCPRLVVSQWNAVSRPTARLMIAFHRALNSGAAPADALRAAELALMRDPVYRHPYFWAPFVIVGTP